MRALVWRHALQRDLFWWNQWMVPYLQRSSTHQGRGQEYYCMLLMALTFLCISSSSSFAATTKLYEALIIGLIFRPTIRKHTLYGQWGSSSIIKQVIRNSCLKKLLLYLSKLLARSWSHLSRVSGLRCFVNTQQKWWCISHFGFKSLCSWWSSLYETYEKTFTSHCSRFSSPWSIWWSRLAKFQYSKFE